MQAQDFLDRIRATHWRYFLINRNMIKNKDLSNMIFCGDMGYGKSACCSYIAEKIYDLKFKIFELYSSPSRMENAFWCFPSKHPFWRKPKITKKGVIKARSYPTRLWYPVTSKAPTKLPTIGQPFKISIYSLDDYDIEALLGVNWSISSKSLWREVSKKIKKSTTGEDLLNIIRDTIQKRDEYGIKIDPRSAVTLVKGIFEPLIRENILCSEKNALAMKFGDILKEREIIDTLVLKHTPQWLTGFLVHYFINNIKKAGVNRVILKLDEVADLLKSNERELSEAGIAIRNRIESIFKQGRDTSLYFLINTQDIRELPQVKELAFFIFVFRTPLINDILMYTGIKRSTGYITWNETNAVTFLEKGECFIFNRKFQRVMLVKIPWCRHRTWEEGDNFYDVWDMYFPGQYKDIKPLLEESNKENLESEKRWKEIKDLRKYLGKK